MADTESLIADKSSSRKPEFDTRIPKDKRRSPLQTAMSESKDTDAGPQISVAVVDKTHANEIPDNIDSELYTTTRPESSLVEFTVDPDSELAEALRRNGFDV